MRTIRVDLRVDRDSLHMALRGPDYLFALQDIVVRIREGMKYQNKDWGEVNDLVWDILNERGIDPYGEVA